jgi:trans-2,3-dihydro-3-hydroxyanthranilate isomerase
MSVDIAKDAERTRRMTSSFEVGDSARDSSSLPEAGGGPPADRNLARAHYELADVFTTTPFGGNPLALFPDASTIPENWLQRIASELNLSETAFAYPLGAGEWKLRIFTPTMEHPFAGHPTIGSALLLAERENLAELTLHEGVGPVSLTIDRSNATIARLTVPMEPEERSISAAPDEIASMISLDPDQVENGLLAPRAMSCGVPFLFIRVTDSDAVRASRLQKDRWQALVAASWAPHVYVFTVGDGALGKRAVHSRMFAPLMGIDEDPATGGAAAALAGVLAAQEPALSGEIGWTISQGIEMGRPSLLELSAHLADGRVTDIRVGGSAVRMGRGSLDLSLMGKAR